MPLPVDELRLLIRSRHPIITVETDEEGRALQRIRDVVEALGVPLYVWNVVEGLHSSQPNARIPKTQKSSEVLNYILARDWPAVFVLNELCVHLTDPRLERTLRTIALEARHRNQTLVLIDPVTRLPPALDRLSVPFEVPLPDEADLERILRDTFRELSRFATVRAELTKDEFRHVVRTLRGMTAEEARLAVSRVILDDDCLNAADINRLLGVKREMIRADGLLEYITALLGLDDLGGLDRLKAWLARRAGALSQRARDFGLDPPRGILLLGVQGCGKSAACKAVAAAWQMPLLKLDPGQFYDKYVGESERNLRKAIRQAESMAPVVLWIDEIEKAFASAATESADGGLSKRMFATLLNWLQDHRSPIFCAATANDIAALPPELMRKGRFDEIFFVDLPGQGTREKILEIHLRRRQRDPDDFELSELAVAAEGFSGAEIEQAIVSALYAAFAERRDLTTQDIRNELEQTRPLSVTMAERVANLRSWAAERCVPAG